jgi:NTE family protein
MVRGCATALALLVALTGTAPARGEDPHAPRLALALSGGGARGIAHIGALRALEEAGVPVDAIAANSMGAVVGGIYATGRTADELDEIVLSVDWGSLFSGRSDRRMLPVTRRQDRLRTLGGVGFSWSELELSPGLMAEHRVNRFLIQNLAPAGYSAGGKFDRLPIPFRCVATDLDDGERLILSQGDLALAVRASMSIPVAFPPVYWEGHPLVDGLVVDNLPVDVAREFGAPVVVAVDVGSPPMEPDEYESALGVAGQVTDLLSKRRNEDFAAEADVYVRPELGRHSPTDYSGFDELIQKGYDAMKEALPKIRAELHAKSHPGAMAPRRPETAGPTLDGTPIADVAVRGNERLSAKVLLKTFNIPTGPGFILEKGLRAFDKVEATGLLEHAWMEFQRVPEGLGITLVVREAPPNRAEVGAAFTEWERARGVVRLLNRNTFGFGEETSLLLVASEAEVGATLGVRGDMPFFYPLGYRAEGFVVSDRPRFFDADGTEVNRAQFERRGVDLLLQSSLERWGLLEAGLRLGNVNTEFRPGLALPVATDSTRTFLAGVVVDTLDDLLWPESGYRMAVHGWWSSDALGATWPYWRVEGEGRVGQRLGDRITLQLDALVGVSGEEVPIYDWFRIGGPYLIPGYAHEQLKGPQALAGAVSLRYRLVGQLQALARAGGGQVFQSRSDIGFDDLRWGVGVGVVYESRVGPLAAEMGWRNGGTSLFSLSLGWN